METLANKCVLECKFNFQIKQLQLLVIQSILDKRDTFAVLPTGYGKSVCYWLPPLMLNAMQTEKLHTSLVITPLKAIIQDQVKTLKEHNIPAYGIFEGADSGHLTEIKDGKAVVLFVSPEAIIKKSWRKTIQEVYGEKLCMIVYDEAHCISEWGLDFREDYRKVGVLHSVFDCPVVCLTATCTDAILTDISTILGLKDLHIITCLPNRTNTMIYTASSSEKYEEELDWLPAAVRSNGGNLKKMIIYVNSVAVCERLYIWLHSVLKDDAYIGKRDVHNRIIEMFHSKTAELSKTRILDILGDPNGTLRVLIATVAVGMGVDIPDISLIVIWGLPPSLLQYWQECGRSGRDGRRSLAVCYAFRRSAAVPCERCRRLNLPTCVCKDRVYMKALLSSKECQRVYCLRPFALDARTKEELLALQVKTKCDGNCSSTCDCRMCKCCFICMSNCQCPAKNTTITGVLDYYISI